MARTAIYHDKYHLDSEGRGSVTIRVTVQETRRYLPTPFRLTSEEFKKMNGERPRDELKQTRLELGRLEKKVDTIIKEMDPFDWAVLKKKYSQSPNSNKSLRSAFEAYISQRKKNEQHGTAEALNSALKSLEAFKKGLQLTDITVDFLRAFERWMEERGRTPATTGIYLRALRSVYNQAIKDEVITSTGYPFKGEGYQIPQGANIKKALDTDTIAKIRRADLSANTSREQARDFWFFLFMANGMNVKDFCLLRFKNIDGQLVGFRREKTKNTKKDASLIKFTLQPEMTDIIKKWGNKDSKPENFIFPILTPGMDSATILHHVKLLTRKINKNMEAVRLALKIPFAVKTYNARHSFATILRNGNFETSIISDMLGHQSEETTKRYLAQLDTAKVIDVGKEIMKSI